jgi:hypothetical protein
MMNFKIIFTWDVIVVWAAIELLTEMLEVVMDFGE